MEYRDLTTQEKIERLQEYNAWKEERHYVAVYLNALRRGDRPTIDEYESFGDDPCSIIKNHRVYDRRLIFGFADKTLNEYGWLDNTPFIDVERIEFIDRKGWAAMNYVTIGRGANGKWSYGVSYSTGGSGGCCGLSVWGNVFDSREECLATALKTLIHRHDEQRERLKDDRANFNPTLSNKVVGLVTAMLNELTIAKQLTLSFI